MNSSNFGEAKGPSFSADRKALSFTEQKKLIQPAVDQVVSEAVHLGLSEAQLQQLISQTYAKKQK